MTSSLVAKMFRAVSLGALSGHKMDNVAKGISAAAALKKLKGAGIEEFVRPFDTSDANVQRN